MPCRVPGWSLFGGVDVFEVWGSRTPSGWGVLCFVGHVCPVSGVSPHGLWVSPRAVPMSPLLGHWTQTVDLGSHRLGPHLLGVLPPPPPLSWAPCGGLQRGFASPPSCHWCLVPHPAPCTPFPAWGPPVQAGGSFWVGFAGNAEGEAPAQGPSGGGSRGFNWFHLG